MQKDNQKKGIQCLTIADTNDLKNEKNDAINCIEFKSYDLLIIASNDQVILLGITELV